MDDAKSDLPGMDQTECPLLFQRVKRVSSIWGFIAVVIGFLFAGLFMLVGSAGLIDNKDWPVTMVFGTIGLGLFAVTLRGAWALALGPMIHVISFEPDQIAWGYPGREKVLQIEEMESIRWVVDTENQLHLSVVRRDGKRVRFYYIDQLVRRGDRGELLSFIKHHYAHISLYQDDRS